MIQNRTFNQTINISDGLLQDADYIALWNGENWAALGCLWNGYDPTCRYCGLDTGSGYTCQHCQAPTPKWWSRLDEMLAECGRRMAG